MKDGIRVFTVIQTAIGQYHRKKMQTRRLDQRKRARSREMLDIGIRNVANDIVVVIYDGQRGYALRIHQLQGLQNSLIPIDRYDLSRSKVQLSER